jgi:hypothetical protein
MEGVDASETSMEFYRTTRHHTVFSHFDIVTCVNVTMTTDGFGVDDRIFGLFDTARDYGLQVTITHTLQFTRAHT